MGLTQHPNLKSADYTDWKRKSHAKTQRRKGKAKDGIAAKRHKRRKKKPNRRWTQIYAGKQMDSTPRSQNLSRRRLGEGGGYKGRILMIEIFSLWPL
jgi:hypothetical protein